MSEEGKIDRNTPVPPAPQGDDAYNEQFAERFMTGPHSKPLGTIEEEMTRAHRKAAQFKRGRHNDRVDPTAGLRLLERANWAATPLPDHKINDVQLLALASLDAILNGRGTAEERQSTSAQSRWPAT